MNTVADQIIDHLSFVRGEWRTSSQIARAITRPAPSVRRTLRQLENRGAVRVDVSDVSINRYAASN
jgi:DNA-binding IclR family transcriptional regulator